MDEPSAEFRIDPDRKIIVISVSGLVRPLHLAAMQQRARLHPHFDPNLGVLLDLREADLAMLSADDIRRLAASSPAARDARRAILVRYEVQATLARLFALFLEMDKRRDTRIFHEEEEAMAWIQGSDL